MFDTFLAIFRIPELRRRIGMTLALLAVWRLGVHIPMPGVDAKRVQDAIKALTGEQGSILGFLNVFSGGALFEAGVFALGIMPYISASIIFSLLVKIIPQLEAIAKEGPAGYRKINQYTRLATVPLCVVQSLYSIGFLKSHQLVAGEGGFGFALTTIFALTAGTMFVMWLGEQITEHGVGNGASLIIMSGIVDRLPGTLYTMFRKHQDFGTEKIVLLIALYVLVVVGIVFTTQAQRRIPIQPAKHVRGRRIAMMGQRQYVPFRLNQANVMPVIFASAVMVIPLLFAYLVGLAFGPASGQSFAEQFRPGRFWYVSAYVVLVIFFSYFWVSLMFKPDEIANNFKEWGTFIPGIRPGHPTAEYLEYIFNRITLVGAAFLCIVALIPDMVAGALGMERYLAAFLGGTGILIVVGVGLDLIQKIESHLLMRHYSGFLGAGGGRIRGRGGRIMG